MRARAGGAIALALVAASGSGWSQDTAQALTSPFNQLWLEAVISIECRGCRPRQELPSPGTPTPDPDPVGTGFLLQTPRNHVLLVTAKHVVLAPRPPKSRLGYRLNTASGSGIVIWDDDLQKSGLGPWHLSATADVACRFVAWPPDARVVTISLDDILPSGRLSAGAPALVLGFPLGLRATDHTRPIARHGIVARADEDALVVDAFVFPGNSGGPVVYTPPFKAGRGILSPFVAQEKLIGVVSSFIPYSEPAISPQTGRTRVVFEENSGLAQATPAQRVLDLVKEAAVVALDGTLR